MLTSGPHGPLALIHMTLLYSISTHLCLTTVNMRKYQQMLLARHHVPSLWWCHLSVKQTLHCQRAVVLCCPTSHPSLNVSFMLNINIADIFLWLSFVMQLDNRESMATVADMLLTCVSHHPVVFDKGRKHCTKALKWRTTEQQLTFQDSVLFRRQQAW